MPRLVDGLEQVFTSLGIVGAGYKLFFFETTTTTPKTTYSDSAFTIPNTNPVICDSTGRPEFDIWGSDISSYKLILGTPDSIIGNINPIITIDPIDNVITNSIIDINPLPAAYWGVTTGDSTDYILNPALVPITSYDNKQCFFIDFHTPCGILPTININDIGQINLKKYTGQGTKAALLAGDVQAQRYIATIDGVDCVILNPRTQILYLGKPPTITIVNGVVDLTNSASNYLIDTEAAAATDNLDTINGGAAEQMIVVGSVDDAKDVVLRHNVGNIWNPAKLDITLGLTTDKVELLYSSALSKWIVVAYPPSTTTLYFESAEQDITQAGSLTIPHGLKINGVGAIPKKYLGYLICKSAEGGYAAGDETRVADYDTNDNGIGHGITIVPDAINLFIRYGTSPGVFDILRKDNGTNLSITANKWKLIIRASLNF